jgi:hypothetical protein
LARHEGKFEAAAEAELGEHDRALLDWPGFTGSREAALVRFLVGDDGVNGGVDEARKALGGSFAASGLTDVKRD